MNHPFWVEVLQSEGNLSIYDGGLGLVYSFFVDDFIKKVSALGVFHDEVELFGGFNDLVQLDDEGMPEFFHDFEFTCDSNDICVLEDEIFFEYFNCDVFLCNFVQGQLDFTKVALAQSFRNYITLEWLVLLFLATWLLLSSLLLVLNKTLIALSDCLLWIHFGLFLE